METMKKHILLVYPSCEKNNPDRDSDFDHEWKNLPIGILSVGTFIQEQGFTVRIVDCRALTKKQAFEEIDASITKDTLCVGFSIMTMQVGHGLELIDHVKKKYKLPIILGGIHCTLFPHQTLQDKNVDYIVQGEGEYCFYALLNYLNGDMTTRLDTIDGLGYKSKRKIFVNRVGAPLDVEKLPFPDYDLMGDIERYIQRRFFCSDGSSFETRSMDLHTSRGCPFQCTYCINTLPCFKKWRSKKLDDILVHIDFVVTHYKIDFIWFMDDFFFGNIERVRSIARHIVEQDYKVRWEATVRASLFRPTLLNDETLKLLKRSGCFSLGMGYESGSDRILKKIKKAITVKDIVSAVKACKKYGIMPRGSFMCGFPTETKEEVKMTGNLLMKLKQLYPRGIYYSPSLLRPYPGAELYDECVQYGFKQPQSFREWGAKVFDFGAYVSTEELPWLQHPVWLRNYQVYLHLAMLRMAARRLHKRQSPPYAFFGAISCWRIKHDYFGLSIEPTMLIKARRMFS
jgi:anaerobic magnesium-protoporphyrin IX monomethyl ester cyclase